MFNSISRTSAFPGSKALEWQVSWPFEYINNDNEIKYLTSPTCWNKEEKRTAKKLACVPSSDWLKTTFH